MMVISGIGTVTNNFSSAHLTESPMGPRKTGANDAFDVQEMLGTKGTRFMDRTTALALVASRRALENAQVDNGAIEQFGIVLGSINGSVEAIASMVEETYTVTPPHHVSAMEFPNTVMNSPAGNCAIWHKIKGINATISAGLLSGLSAIEYASEKIALGYVETALVGAVEEYSTYTQRWIDHDNALAGRDAIALSEGAAFFVMEKEITAHHNKRVPYLKILGCATQFDANLSEPERLTKLIDATLKSARLDWEDIGLVIGSGIPVGNVKGYEQQALAQALNVHDVAQIALFERFGSTQSVQNLFQIYFGAMECRDKPVLVIAADPIGHIGAALVLEQKGEM